MSSIGKWVFFKVSWSFIQSQFEIPKMFCYSSKKFLKTHLSSDNSLRIFHVSDNQNLNSDPSDSKTRATLGLTAVLTTYFLDFKIPNELITKSKYRTGGRDQ